MSPFTFVLALVGTICLVILMVAITYGIVRSIARG